MNKTLFTRLLLIALVATAAGCGQLKTITDSLSNLNNLEFKLADIQNMRLAGVDISKLSDPSKLSIADGISLANAFGRKSLPTSFVLNVDAHNPNDGQGGSRSVPVTLNGLDWRLLIDGKQTIAGDLDRPIDIPGTSANTTIPLRVDMDMYQFFSDRGYDGILNLALALGGVQGSTSKVKLDAMPSVGTPMGTMTYPNRITIVDSEFRGK